MLTSAERSMNDKIPRFSVSVLAHSLHYNCKKQIYLLPSAKDPKLEKVYTVADSLFERGNDFEKELCDRHALLIVDHTYSKDFLQVLKDAQPGKYLYQLRFTMPESFYTDVLLTNTYRMNSFIPDFLYIHKDPVTLKRKIRIIDAKSSKQMTTSHQFQVATYAFFLDYIIKDIPDLEIDEIGGVWLPSNKDSPVQFRVNFVVNTVKHVYTNTLPEILQDKNPDWKLNKRCTSCYFYKQCKTDAEGTLKSMPYLKSSNMLENDIEDLADLLGDLTIDTSAKQSTDVEHYMEAFRLQQPRFLGHPTVSIASETDHSIFMYLQMDLYTLKPFVYGFKVINAQNEEIFQSSYSVPYEQLKDNLEVSSEFADRFVRDLEKILDDMDQLESRCLFYVYDEREKTTLNNYLYHLVDSDGKDLVTLSEERKQQVVTDATKCLVSLFQDTQLLNLPEMINIPKLNKEASVGRFVSIEKLLEQNIALGISGYYQLVNVVKWMAQGGDVDELDKLVELNADKIYHYWRDGTNSDTEQLMPRRFTWLQKIMSTFWDLANNSIQNELFPLSCAPFKWPELQSLKSSLIAKLLLFKQLECFKSCDEVRMDRIRDLSSVDYPSGLVLHLNSTEKTDISPWVWKLNFSVDPAYNGPLLQQKIDNLSIDTMRQYILVPDTKEGIIEAIKYSDLLEMDIITSRKKLGIKCVDVAHKDGNTIVLHGIRITMSIKRWRLYRRYVDSTTVSCINSLQEFDTEPNWRDVEHLVTDPNDWAEKNVSDDIGFNTKGLPKEILTEFNMSPSQLKIVENIFKKRLQIVWGPPGSGKTEFLALFINWYIKCHLLENADDDKEIVIGITACTREAILNLLKRIEKVQKEHGLQDQFSILYVAYSSPDNLPADSNIETRSYDKVLAHKNAIKKTRSIRVFIVGATVWHWIKVLKSRKRFLGCDMMILDESTQLLVSDAVMAIYCLSKPTGKLIVAGDHMQLGPIIKNDYSNTKTTLGEPLLYGSIQQCLMRTVENRTIYTRKFLLQKGAVHDLGPNTWQLNDNWRMNGQLNKFFQQVYGPDYVSRRPDSQLELDWNLLTEQDNDIELIKSIMDPTKSISLVKLKSDNINFDPVQSEATIVQKLIRTYFTVKKETLVDKDGVDAMIVTPHHIQRVAIQRSVDELSLDAKIRISTVEKLQGQECDLVFACFSCFNHVRGAEFLRDFRRWNVALSRAKRKVIVLSVDRLINPDPTEGMFDSLRRNTLEPTDGYALLYLLQKWAKETDSVWDWIV